MATSGQHVTGNDPNDANVPSNSTFQQRWVQHLVGRWGTNANGGLRYYILDNEPSLWHGTHRDVRPTGPSARMRSISASRSSAADVRSRCRRFLTTLGSAAGMKQMPPARFRPARPRPPAPARTGSASPTHRPKIMGRICRHRNAPGVRVGPEFCRQQPHLHAEGARPHTTSRSRPLRYW